MDPAISVSKVMSRGRATHVRGSTLLLLRNNLGEDEG